MTAATTEPLIFGYASALIASDKVAELTMRMAVSTKKRESPKSSETLITGSFGKNWPPAATNRATMRLGNSDIPPAGYDLRREFF